ncbi:MAG: transcriptional repressor [Thermodesulfobacteriota bacterium]
MSAIIAVRMNALLFRLKTGEYPTLIMLDKGEELIRNKNLRITRQRKLILEILRKMKTHLSADELYDAVRVILPKISLGTVYRNLEILSELGQIQKLELGGATRRYDWNTDKHYHIRCVECGRVDDAPVAPLQQIENDLYGATVFTIIGHRLEFTGFCPKCSQNSRIE